MDKPSLKTSADNALLSSDYESLFEALQTLYIPGNQSGRIVFLKAWPVVAEYLFGSDLIGMDIEGEGRPEDRPALEERARERHCLLVVDMDDLEARCLDHHGLNEALASDIIARHGRDVASLIFSARVINRVWDKAEEKIKKAAALKAGHVNIDDVEDGDDNFWNQTEEPVKTPDDEGASDRRGDVSEDRKQIINEIQLIDRDDFIARRQNENTLDAIKPIDFPDTGLDRNAKINGTEEPVSSESASVKGQTPQKSSEESAEVRDRLKEDIEEPFPFMVDEEIITNTDA